MGARKVLQKGLTLEWDAAHFNVSAKTASKWVGRFREGGCEALRDRSSRPRRSPRRTPSAFIERISLSAQLRWNGWRIARELQLSRATASRILHRTGMNRLRSIRRHP